MPRPPNILWIVTTQWRAQACGYAGDPNACTPQLDAFAAEAVNFRQAVTPHPFGPFARAALLTGVRSPANGVRDYFDPLPPRSRTIAHELRERGYRTAFFGKWHLAPRNREASLVGEAHARTIVPEEFRGGFEVWEGFESGFLLNDPWLHGTRLPRPVQFRGYQSDVVCGRAAGWIRTAAGSSEPWYAVVSLEPPHPPYGAPAAGRIARDPSLLVLRGNVPAGSETEGLARRELAGYYAHIEATDAAIGALLKGVDREQTIAVVTSVHGDMHGSHGLFRKGWPYEESIRVPLLVRVPETVDRGCGCGVREDLVSLVDLPRWTVAWADGVGDDTAASLAQQISMPSVVALPHQCDRAWRGVRTQGEKLVVEGTANPGGAERAEPWLYFDLADDPAERRNLASDPARQARIAHLASLIEPA